ncbi:hypothetical protein [Anaerobutyricum hallii]|uniref:hypothetical protein n=1 Tax=Anaerobutyricum hallii TaxID=39488 RepID=UPI001FA890FD|nr:hypothetical protein [Anaerobutyricum hallii]
MERMLEGMVIFVAKIHNYILSLNDAYEKNFTDKQLHFLVIGILGMLILMVIYPLFKLLSENHILVIAFIYVFTVIVVITFAIEIGQKISDSGTMDFADIVFGIAGFLLMFCDFCCYKTNFSGNYQFVPKNRKTLERV